MFSSILLLGPTGSGKTPLGDLMERRGLWGARCLHFDFGANLRRLVEEDRPDAHVTRADLDFLREVLRTGALLEDEHFPLAARVLQSFLARRGHEAGTVPSSAAHGQSLPEAIPGENGDCPLAAPQPILVLNGLPRHVGQAEAVGRLAEVRAVVHLVCPAEVALQRIRTNAGGDRAGRPDDDLDSVRAKLAIYGARTAPLTAHYQARGVPIHALEITAAMTPEEAWERLERARA